MSERLALLSFHVLVYSSHLKVTVIANIKSMLRMVSGSRWVGCSACARLLYTYYISKWLHDDVRLLSHSSIVVSSKWVTTYDLHVNCRVGSRHLPLRLFSTRNKSVNANRARIESCRLITVVGEMQNDR